MKRRQRLRAQRRRLLAESGISNRRVAMNTVVLYFRMILVMLVGLFTSRVVLKALGVTDFGLYNVVGAAVGMFVFMNGTLSAATSRYITVEIGHGTPGSLKRLFSTLLSLHVAFALLVVLLLEVLGPFWLLPRLNIPVERLGAAQFAFQCVVVTTFFSITQVPYSSVLVARERMAAFAYMSIYDVVAKLVIAYGVMVTPFDRLETYAVLMALVGLSSMVIYRTYCLRNFPEARWRRVFNWQILRPLLAFAGCQVAASLCIMLLTQGITMLNQRYFGPTIVTAGALATGVYGHVMGFVNNFKTAAVPQIVKSYSAGDYATSKRLLKDTTKFSVALLLIFGCPTLVYAPELVALWLGQGNVPEYLVPILRILLAAALFSVFDVSFYTILYASGNLAGNAVLNIICGGVTFVIACIGVAWIGHPLFAFAMLACNTVIIGGLCKPYLLHRVAGYTLRDIGAVFVPSFSAATMTMIVTWGVKSCLWGSLWRICLGLGLACCVSAGVCFLLLFSVAQRRAVIHALRGHPTIVRLLGQSDTMR